MFLRVTKPLGMQASIVQCLSQARINWEGCDRKGIWHKNGVWLMWRHWRFGWGASASVIFPCTIKSKRWWAVMEDVDKGCSELWITVGTVTSTAGILIHSRLRHWLLLWASHPADFGCMLALLGLTALTGSKLTLLSVRILLLPHGGEWANVSSGTGSPQVVPDTHPFCPRQRAIKRLCVCVCMHYVWLIIILFQLFQVVRKSDVGVIHASFILSRFMVLLFCWQVIIPTPAVAKTPSAATAAVTRDAEAAVTGLVHIFKVCRYDLKFLCHIAHTVCKCGWYTCYT